MTNVIGLLFLFSIPSVAGVLTWLIVKMIWSSDE